MKRIVFLELDTDSLFMQNMFATFSSSKLTNEQVLAHTVIYKGGSMSLGSSVGSFTIGQNQGIKKGDEIFFSIQPLKLISQHQVFFNYNGLSSSPICHTSGKSHSIKESDFKLITGTNNPLSFGIKIIADITKDQMLAFGLKAQIDFGVGFSKIDLCIDPRLKIGQGE